MAVVWSGWAVRALECWHIPGASLDACTCVAAMFMVSCGPGLPMGKQSLPGRPRISSLGPGRCVEILIRQRHPPPTPHRSCAAQVVKDDAYLDGDFISTVQQRGAAIIKVGRDRRVSPRAGSREMGCLCAARGRLTAPVQPALRPAACRAPSPPPPRPVTTSATGCWEPQVRRCAWGGPCGCDPCHRPVPNRRFILRRAEGTYVSMGVISDGSYGAPKDVIFSFPCTCKDGKWSIVQVRGLKGQGAATPREPDMRRVKELVARTDALFTNSCPPILRRASTSTRGLPSCSRSPAMSWWRRRSWRTSA